MSGGRLRAWVARFNAWRDRNYVRSETRRAYREFETGTVKCAADRNLPMDERQSCSCAPDWARKPGDCGWR